MNIKAALAAAEAITNGTNTTLPNQLGYWGGVTLALTKGAPTQAKRDAFKAVTDYVNGEIGFEALYADYDYVRNMEF